MRASTVSLIVDWPVGLGADGNEGVADFVWRVPGTIGYAALAFARAKRLNVPRSATRPADSCSRPSTVPPPPPSREGAPR